MNMGQSEVTSQQWTRDFKKYTYIEQKQAQKDVDIEDKEFIFNKNQGGGT